MGIFEDDNHLFAETKEAMFGRTPWPKEPPTVKRDDAPYNYDLIEARKRHEEMVQAAEKNYDDAIRYINADLETGQVNEATTAIRTFDTGATRDTDHDKLDFEGFLSPRVLEAFAWYMHANRLQKDGSLRDSDNWQKGIPVDAYMSSMWRHFFDVWKCHRGLHTTSDIETNLCALLFNVQGMLHEVLRARQSHNDIPF